MTEELIIDWNLGLKLAGGKIDLAEDILAMVTQNLADEVKKIETAFKNKNIKLMQQMIHKIHGGISYAGTPRLKKAIATLATALTQNKTDQLPTLLEKFITETKLLLDTMQKTKLSQR